MEISWEYLGGLFDGEGTICFARYKNRNHISRYVTIAIGQCEKNKEVIYLKIGRAHV